MIAELIAGVEFLNARLQTLLLREVVDLGANRDALCDRHIEGAAVILGVGQGRQPRRRVTRVDVLHVKRHLTVAKIQQLFGRQAEVGTARIGLGIDERQRIVTDELETPVVGKRRRRDLALALRLLHLEPRLRSESQRDIGGVQAAVADIVVIIIRGDAQLDVIAEPDMRLTAE